jgi:L-lactate dehydrogenase (cytochrome)
VQIVKANLAEGAPPVLIHRGFLTSWRTSMNYTAFAQDVRPEETPMKRQLPKRRDLAPLLRFKQPTWSPQERRLAKALTIDDLRRIAKRRTPKAAFDYADGAADGEVSLARAREAFADVEFRPAILRDVSKVDTSRVVLGQRVELPFGIAPTGFTRMMHAEGEIAGATAAAAAGIPFALSTMGTTSIEDVAAASPPASGGRNWFQLYMWKDRDRSMALVDRAAAAGFDTLLVTVDVPVAGARLRDVRNGMTIPPTLTLRTVVDALPRPAWWQNFLTAEPLAFASLDSWSGTVAELLDTMFDPTVTYHDLAWIRNQWPGRIVVKAVQTVSDARRVADLGVDAVLLSNHGGRQLDRAPVPFHLLPDVVKAVGADVEVHLDTGIMSGQDIVAALAHGAHFTLIGRAYLYGLMAGGRDGVDRSLEILRGQLERTMRLLGVTTLDELEPDHVAMLRRLRPHA